MMKKEYETPEMEVIEIGNEDVVTASCDNTYDVLTPEICELDKP